MEAEELKRIRELLGYTQGELAAKCGVGLRAYQRWEDTTGGASARTISGPAEMIVRSIVKASEEQAEKLAKQRAKKLKGD